MLELTLKILEFKAGSFTDETSNRLVEFSYAIVRFNEREYKMNSKINLEAFVGEEADFYVSATPDKNRKMTFVIEKSVNHK
jgi:hypothetical protein